MEQWSNELRVRIIEDDDKVLFDEALGCLQNGQKRASYIMAWIMIVESLKRKIKILSNFGDSKSNEATEKIEKAESDKISTDKLIFEEAQKCGIIDTVDMSTINFLWQQRCLFAHPYNIQPEEDEVRYIITQGIKLVLSKEVFYSKDFLAELADNLANKPFYLSAENDKITQFARNLISRTPTSLHPFLFKTLLFKIGEISTKPEKFNELRKIRICIVLLFKNTTLSLESGEWSIEHRVTNYPFECFIGFVHPEIWQKLPDRIKEMLIDYFTNESDPNKLIHLKSIGKNLNRQNVLTIELKEKYVKKINSFRFDSAIDFYGDDLSQFARIKSELESWQFDQQNAVIDYIKEERGIKWLESVDKENQFYLGRLLRACAANGHWKTQSIIESIVNKSFEVPEEIKAGISYACFISKQDKYFLNSIFVVRAIKLLEQINLDLQKSIYCKIINILREEKVNELDRSLYSEASLIELSTQVQKEFVDISTENETNFENLIEEIKKYYA